MDSFTRTDLAEAMDVSSSPAVSIYMPLHRRAEGAEEDRLRFKNLLKEARSSLAAAGSSDREAKELLAPAERFHENHDHWTGHSADGLAVLLARGASRHYRLEEPFQEVVVASHRFHLKPLLRFLLDNRRFYVLSLTKDSLRMYAGDRFGMRRTKLPDGVPESLPEGVGVAEIEKSMQHHSAPTGKRPGTVHGVRHGHGEPKDQARRLLEEYFRRVGTQLQAFLEGERVPLVMAGVEYLPPMLEASCASGFLLAQAVHGSPSLQDERELHAKAWRVVEPWFQNGQGRAAERFLSISQGAASGLASDAIEEVVRRAAEGRVETVFVSSDRSVWGRYVAEEDIVEAHPEQEPGDLDLTSVAAEETFVRGGQVYIVPSTSVPGRALQGVAGVFRW